MIVFDVCKEIHDRVGDGSSAAKDHGLFLAEEDQRKGHWLDPSRTLNYYDIKSGVRSRRRVLRVRAGLRC